MLPITDLHLEAAKADATKPHSMLVVRCAKQHGAAAIDRRAQAKEAHHDWLRSRGIEPAFDVVPFVEHAPTRKRKRQPTAKERQARCDQKGPRTLVGSA